MSTWAYHRKKGCLISLALVLFVIIAGIILWQVLRQDATCFDGKQNQDERGIDCGGVCDRVCLSDARPLVPQFARALLVSNNLYTLVAYVENQNAESGIRELPYVLSVYDVTNTLIGEFTGVTSVGPNQRVIIFEPLKEFGGAEPARVFVSFPQAPNWSRTSSFFARQHLRVGQRRLTGQESLPLLEARIENSAFEPFFNVEVTALVYDTDDVLIGASRTFIDIPSGEGMDVRFTWPLPFQETIGRFEIIPRIPVFDPRNARMMP